MSNSRTTRWLASSSLPMVVSGIILVSSFVVREWTQIDDPVLTAPAGMTTTSVTTVGDVSMAALSRDGRYVAFVESQDGVSSLWLQRVGAAHPAQLRRSSDPGPRALAFTPNGDAIVFTEDSALYELPIAGGDARRIRNRVGAGLALSPDGKRIAFVRLEHARQAWTLVVAGADSTTPEHEVATLPLPQQFSEYGPAWSPDAKTLTLGATSRARPAQFALTSVRIADGRMEVLDPHRWDAISKVVWQHDGQGIAFQAVTFPSSFHVWHLALSSETLRRLTTGVAHYSRASLSVSDDGRSLLVVRSESNSGIWVAPSADIGHAQPVTRLGFGRLDGTTGLAWTPNGRLVYSSVTDSGSALWAITPGGTARPLTSPGSFDRLPQATADGRFIVFESNRAGGSDVWRIDADGRHSLRLTSSEENGQPSVTPNGQSVFYTDDANEGSSIWRMTIEGGSKARVAPIGSSWPRVSPDGKFLAYVSTDTSSSPGAIRLTVISIGDQRTVAQFEVARGGTISNGLRWTPDGSALVYRNLNGGLWRQPIAGGDATKMPDIPDERIYFFDWTNDGRTFAMSYGNEVRDVVLMHGFK